jgi:serpin B
MKNDAAPPSPPVSMQIPEKTGPDTNAEKSVVDANKKFALNLFLRLCRDAQYSCKNLFFSPFSISSSLAIIFEGARGSTADEIRTVFFFPDDDNQRRLEYEQLCRDTGQENSRSILKTANALWAEKTCPFLTEYVNTARRYYHAHAMNLDFRNQAEISRVTINKWVEDQTDNKIRDLISRGAIDHATRLVITNAVYFKGTWKKPFDRNNTRQDVFYVTHEETVPVRMMQNTDQYNYTETVDLQVLGIPYAKGSEKQISMLVLLPKMYNLASIEELLTVRKLSELGNALTSREVHVMVPKFRLETRYDLSTTLASMGMPAAFTDQADFSGMSGEKNLFIKTVIHKAFLDVHEEGTEAAAATGEGWEMAPPDPEPVPVFYANHPFLCIIQENKNENILFIGRVSNPDGL